MSEKKKQQYCLLVPAEPKDNCSQLAYFKDKLYRVLCLTDKKDEIRGEIEALRESFS
jgi:hypothetical protein